MLSNSVNQVIFDTGNTLTCTAIKFRTSQTINDELVQTVGHALDKWLPSYDPEMYAGSTTISVVNSLHQTAINVEDRTNLRITLKIFLATFDGNMAREAIEEALKRLRVTALDVVIIAFPNVKYTLEAIQPIWQVLEKLVRNGSVNLLGVCDLNAEDLKELYSWATVKPMVNQVNLDSCCVMPVDLTSFAKENDIQLLTHSDPRCVLPLEDMPKMMGKLIESENEKDWAVSWLVRFSVTVKSRGILQSTGYFVSTIRAILKEELN